MVTRSAAAFRWTAIVLALVITASACGDGDEAEGVSVVATTTILGDVARRVVGDRGTVTVLMPAGADPHEYQASSRQISAMHRADLVIANGLGLEEGLRDPLESASGDGANLLEIAPLLDPIPFSDGHDLDPHVWHDPIRMTAAARIIAEELAAVDPSVDWGARAEAYAGELEAVHREIESTLAAVPGDGRLLVTGHDYLEYFADRYGFEVVGVVVPGGSTLADVSSAELAELVATMERDAIPAIFIETHETGSLADTVAAEFGGRVQVVELYGGSLGEPGSEAEDLVGLLITNARRIAEALS